jgi:hypothetical protein
MADVHAHAGAGANNCAFIWDLDFVDAANTVTINATHKHFDGTPAPDPVRAWITVILNTSVEITVDTVTGLTGTPNGDPNNLATVLTGTVNFSQASPGEMLNAGPKTRTGVRLKVSADRAAMVSFATTYMPPA